MNRIKCMNPACTGTLEKVWVKFEKQDDENSRLVYVRKCTMCGDVVADTGDGELISMKSIMDNISPSRRCPGNPRGRPKKKQDV